MLHAKRSAKFREAASAREFRKALDFIGTEPAGVTLVSKRAPRKTVGDDDVPCIERGFNDFVNHLGTGGIVQQEFGIVRHDTLERGVEQEFANAFGNFGAAGFTQPHDLVAFGF